MKDKKAALSFKLSWLDRIVDQIVSPDKDTMTKTGKKASSTGGVAAAAPVRSKMTRVPMPGSEETIKANSSRQIMDATGCFYTEQEEHSQPVAAGGGTAAGSQEDAG